ncbi:MAG: 50S ribosomal protein L32e [Candidatus Woesearchaeota archaeon]
MSKKTDIKTVQDVKGVQKVKDVKKLLSLREHIKRRKPNFIRQDANRQKRVGTRWRKPKGLQSKMRLHKKGNRKSVTKGYKSPAAVYGMLPNGLFPVVVNNQSQLKAVDPKLQAAVISSKVGLRKKIDLIKKAVELNIIIANLKDADKFIKDNDDKMKIKSEEKKKKVTEKEEKKKVTEKSKKEKKDIDSIAEEADNGQEEKDKKIKDKILTTKDSGY